jgi:hypothetical protein
MSDKNILESHGDDTVTFNKRFKRALIVFAMIEFIVIASVFVYKVSR